MQAFESMSHSKRTHVYASDQTVESALADANLYANHEAPIKSLFHILYDFNQPQDFIIT